MGDFEKPITYVRQQWTLIGGGVVLLQSPDRINDDERDLLLNWFDLMRRQLARNQQTPPQESE